MRGLIGTFVIYLLRVADTPAAREYQRNALNFEITLGIGYAFLMIAYFAVFFSFFSFSVTAHGHGVAMIAAAFAARAAWLGKVFHYPVPIPFVRCATAVAS